MSHRSLCDAKDSGVPQCLKDLPYEAAAWGTIGPSGGRLEIPDCNIALTVPEGAVANQSSNQLFYIAVIMNNSPDLTTCQVNLNCYIAFG